MFAEVASVMQNGKKKTKSPPQKKKKHQKTGIYSKLVIVTNINSSNDQEYYI